MVYNQPKLNKIDEIKCIVDNKKPSFPAFIDVVADKTLVCDNDKVANLRARKDNMGIRYMLVITPTWASECIWLTIIAKKQLVINRCREP